MRFKKNRQHNLTGANCYLDFCRTLTEVTCSSLLAVSKPDQDWLPSRKKLPVRLRCSGPYLRALCMTQVKLKEGITPALTSSLFSTSALIALS